MGNGYLAWSGLESFIDKCHAAGIKVGGWWFLYGNAGERSAIVAQVKHLPLDWFVYDSEGQFEASGDCVNKVRAYTGDVRAAKPTLAQALCSWWKPSLHNQPLTTWLTEVDLNMPQVYPMGDLTPNAPVWRLQTAIQEYAAAGWRGPTMPIGAAFHEAGWRSTLEQINNQNASTQAAGLTGISWWVLDQILTDHNQPFLDAIKAHVWADVIPIPQPLTMAQKVDALWAAHPELAR